MLLDEGFRGERVSKKAASSADTGLVAMPSSLCIGVGMMLDI